MGTPHLDEPTDLTEEEMGALNWSYDDEPLHDDSEYDRARMTNRLMGEPLRILEDTSPEELRQTWQLPTPTAAPTGQWLTPDDALAMGEHRQAEIDASRDASEGAFASTMRGPQITSLPSQPFRGDALQLTGGLRDPLAEEREAALARTVDPSTPLQAPDLLLDRATPQERFLQAPVLDEGLGLDLAPIRADLTPMTEEERVSLARERRFDEIEEEKRIGLAEEAAKKTLLDNRAKGMEKIYKKRQELEAKAEKILKEDFARMDDLYEKWSQEKVDPRRIWNNASTGRRIGMVIAAALGGYASEGGRNSAVDIMNTFVKQDIAAQESNLKRRGIGLKQRQSLLERVLAETRDMASAKVVTANLYRQMIADQIGAASQRFAGDKERLKGEKLVTALIEKSAVEDASIRAGRADAAREKVAADFDRWEKDQKVRLGWAKFDLESRKHTLAFGINAANIKAQQANESRDVFRHPGKEGFVVGKYNPNISTGGRNDFNKNMIRFDRIKMITQQLLQLTTDESVKEYGGKWNEFFTDNKTGTIESLQAELYNLIARPLSGANIPEFEQKQFTDMSGPFYKGWTREAISTTRSRWKTLLNQTGLLANRHKRVHLLPHTSYQERAVLQEDGSYKMVRARAASNYSYRNEFSYKEPGPGPGPAKNVKDLGRVLGVLRTTDPDKVLLAARRASEYAMGTGWMAGEVPRHPPKDTQTGKLAEGETLQTIRVAVRDGIKDQIGQYPETKKPRQRTGRESTAKTLEEDRANLAGWKKMGKIRKGLIEQYSVIDDGVGLDRKEGTEQFFSGSPSEKKKKAKESREAADRTQLKRADLDTRRQKAAKAKAKAEAAKKQVAARAAKPAWQRGRGE